MMKDNYTVSNPSLNYLSRSELMILIILENTLFISKREELRTLQITYIQTIDIMSV